MSSGDTPAWQPNWRPYTRRLGGEDYYLRPDNLLVHLYRKLSMLDHFVVIEGVEEGFARTHYFHTEDEARWLAGVVFDFTEKKGLWEYPGDSTPFHEKYGWSPKVTLEMQPPDDILELYAEFEIDEFVDAMGGCCDEG